MEQLILVDEQDRFTGQYADRMHCHGEKGLHHRAFVVVIRHNNKILLQKRKHALWDKFWDVTAVSHVLHFSDHDETYNEAGNRALEKEMGIPSLNLKKVGGFNYFAQYKNNLCENEYCAILQGDWTGKIMPNKNEVYKYTWLSIENFCNDVKKHPKKYTPWTILTAQWLFKEYF